MLALLGDSVTTDHISPAGDIAADESRPAATCSRTACEKTDFNSYGSRRGNDRVMVRGTFANIRLKNLLVPGVEGGVTVHLPVGRADDHLRRGRCATAPRACRWWCSRARSTAPAPRATGRPRAPLLLGVQAVIAESYERIHRSNLVGMGVLPLQFTAGENAEALGTSPGARRLTIAGLRDGIEPRAGR